MSNLPYFVAELPPTLSDNKRLAIVHFFASFGIQSAFFCRDVSFGQELDTLRDCLRKQQHLKAWADNLRQLQSQQGCTLSFGDVAMPSGTADMPASTLNRLPEKTNQEMITPDTKSVTVPDSVDKSTDPPTPPTPAPTPSPSPTASGVSVAPSDSGGPINFKCEVCSQPLLRASLLHVYTHITESRFACTECSYETNSGLGKITHHAWHRMISRVTTDSNYRRACIRMFRSCFPDSPVPNLPPFQGVVVEKEEKEKEDEEGPEMKRSCPAPSEKISQEIKPAAPVVFTPTTPSAKPDPDAQPPMVKCVICHPSSSPLFRLSVRGSAALLSDSLQHAHLHMPLPRFACWTCGFNPVGASRNQLFEHSLYLNHFVGDRMAGDEKFLVKLLQWHRACFPYSPLPSIGQTDSGAGETVEEGEGEAGGAGVRVKQEIVEE